MSIFDIIFGKMNAAIQKEENIARSNNIPSMRGNAKSPLSNVEKNITSKGNGEYNLAEDIAENSNISTYKGSSNPLCIKAQRQNQQRYFLEHDMENLLKKYPLLGSKSDTAADFFDNIIQKEFPEGFPSIVFVRNYTLESESESERKFRRLAIRPKRVPDDYLSHAGMPDNKTLLFKGYVSGNYFNVDSVLDHYDEELLPYETECQIIRYDDITRVQTAGGNFLYDLAEKAASLNDHTRRRLSEWSEYIKWRRDIVRMRMHGVPYTKVENRGGRLAFTLIFDSEADYDAERKWLTRSELAAYDRKEYADENGNFNFKYEEERNSKEKYEPLGALARGFRPEGRETGGHFEIDFVYEIPATDETEEMSQEERENYVQNELLPHYPRTGFLAPLVVKDLSLFKRLDNAVKFLQQDRYCRSPNMAMWLFDVKNARLPQPQERAYWVDKVGNNWLNQNIAKNPDQREAIYKMLEAPDLCLIQGPPGTGKTTVIAEAIYQFARQGNRVLLASQSHDAVDNALDRLADRSEIRAVRLGERDRDNDDERNKFSRSNVISTYYSGISKAVRRTFLTRWEENRRNYEQCQRELRDWQHIRSDLDSLYRDRTNNREKISQCRRSISQKEEELDKVLETNRGHETAKQQYQILADMAKKERWDDPYDEFFMPLEFGDHLANCFVPVLEFASGHGIGLAPFVKREVFISDPNGSLKYVAKGVRTLRTLHDKLMKRRKNKNADTGIAQIRTSEIEEKIERITIDLAEEDDPARRTELKEQRNQLREERERLRDGGAIALSDEESRLISNFKESIQDSEKIDEVIQILSDIISACSEAFKKSVRLIADDINSYQPQDINALEEQVRVDKGQKGYLDSEGERIEREISEKENLSRNLSEKYHCDKNEISEHIKNKMENLDSEWERDADIRDVWQGTLEKFVQKLDDENTAIYDKNNYLDIYENSCNVVGITCTANMRDLDEKFTDFDVVIIDEVSKATPPELLPPLMRARKTILVGDHRQLPPVFNEYEKPYSELIAELEARRGEDGDDENPVPFRPEDLDKYRKMVTSSLFGEYFEQADDRIKHSLLTQYRMHSDIQRVINRFYDGKLENGLRGIENEQKAHGLDVLTDSGESFLRQDSHAYWVDSSKLQGKTMEHSMYQGSTSLHNIFEKYIVLAVLRKLNDAYASMGKTGIDVGVISFYGSQVRDLRKAVRELRSNGKLGALKVDVNTVDRFQGKEKQIIITSLVCNQRDGRASKHVAAFERINVAFSRAQNLLIIIGAKDLYGDLRVPIPSMETGEISSSRIYKNIIDELSTRGSLIPGETLIAGADLEKIYNEYNNEKEARYR